MGNRLVLSVSRVRPPSANLEPVFAAGAVWVSFCWLNAGTVSHHLLEVNTDDITTSGIDVIFGIGDGVHVGAGFGYGLGFCWI
jgi:hypothetical protein